MIEHGVDLTEAQHFPTKACVSPICCQDPRKPQLVASGTCGPGLGGAGKTQPGVAYGANARLIDIAKRISKASYRCTDKVLAGTSALSDLPAFIVVGEHGQRGMINSVEIGRAHV